MQPEEYLVIRARRSHPYQLVDAWVRTREGIDVGEALAELRIETIEADRQHVSRLREQSDVLSVVPPMPVRLVNPRIRFATSLSSTADVTWGVQAVGAENSTYNA